MYFILYYAEINTIPYIILGYVISNIFWVYILIINRPVDAISLFDQLGVLAWFQNFQSSHNYV